MRIQSPLSRRLARALTRTTALVVLAATVVACGGGDDDPSPAAALVGPAGATVDGPNGARLVVPANALAQPTSISIAMSDAGAPALPSGHVVLGSTFALTPHGTAFAQPATVSVPFDPALLPAGETPVLMKTNATQTGWDPVVGTTVSGSTLQAPIGSFSWVVVALPPVLPTIRTQPLPQAVVAPAAATFAVFATGPTSSGILFFQWRQSAAGWRVTMCALRGRPIWSTTTTDGDSC